MHKEKVTTTFLNNKRYSQATVHADRRTSKCICRQLAGSRREKIDPQILQKLDAEKRIRW